MVGVRGFEPPASTSRMRIGASELGLTHSFGPPFGFDVHWIALDFLAFVPYLCQGRAVRADEKASGAHRRVILPRLGVACTWLWA